MEVNDVYQYSALEGDDAIRLIYLQPCEDLEAGIECSLKDAKLNDYRDDIGDYYIAISYVWGDVRDTRSILVDGKRLTITASLESALRHVRDTQRVLRVWADGVCIDQEDVHDRNRQVRLMGDVYSIALHTIIFLELSSPQCDAVMRMISLGVPYEKESTNNSGRSPSGLTASQFATVVEDESLSRPWFIRVWILQELILSQNPWLQCGQHRIRWHVFCKYVLSSQTSLWKSNSRVILTDMNESRIKFRTASVDIEEKPEEFIGSALLELLHSRRGCALSDPRDMVYAHLGLVGHEARGRIPIDYDKTVAQVYESISCFYIEFAGLETALSLVDYIQPEDRPGFLPSWVTDWSTRCSVKPPKAARLRDHAMPNPFHLKCSRAVPGILAVVGNEYATVDRLIPQSSWPVLTLRGGGVQDAESVLQWMSRSDDEFLVSKQLLIDLVAKKYQRGSHNFTPLGQKPAWAWKKVVSIISKWAEWSTVTTPHINIVTGAKAEEIHVSEFVQKFIDNLLGIDRYYDEFRYPAVLGDGRFYSVPPLARPGDIIIEVLNRSGRSFHPIIRPCKSFPLSSPEYRLIKNDLNGKIPMPLK